MEAPREGTLDLNPACRAVYRSDVVEITSRDDEEVVVPLPAGMRATAVVAVLATGEERPHRFSQGADGVLVFVPASSGPVKSIRIRLAS